MISRVYFEVLNSDLGVEIGNDHSIPASQTNRLNTFRGLKAPTSGHLAQLAALKFPAQKAHQRHPKRCVIHDNMNGSESIYVWILMDMTRCVFLR